MHRLPALLRHLRTRGRRNAGGRRRSRGSHKLRRCCSTCGNICPTDAISFPKLDAVWKLERERQIFRTVKKEALQRHERADAAKVRESAQQMLAHVSTRAKVEIAGEFGDKRFLVRLEELTVKGARQKAPSFMSFEVTSEQQEDIAPFLGEVKKFVHDCALVLVSDQLL